MRPNTHRVAHAAAVAAIPVAALMVIALAGCRPRTGTAASVSPSAGRETLITEEEIVRMSVRSAWDVVRLRAPRVAFAVNQAGRPETARFQEQRSLTGNETPLLVVDGMQVSDFQYLSQLPASEVHAIHILDAEAAQPRYGIRASGGAIVVETKSGR